MEDILEVLIKTNSVYKQLKMWSRVLLRTGLARGTWNTLRDVVKCLSKRAFARRNARKDMIQMHVFLEILFSLDWHFRHFNLQNEVWWVVYFFLRLFFFEKNSLLQIKSSDFQDSGFQSKICTRWHLYNYHL